MIRKIFKSKTLAIIFVSVLAGSNRITKQSTLMMKQIFMGRYKAKTRRFYIAILTLLLVTTSYALFDGFWGISSGVISIIAFISIITSLLPFFIAMRLFAKYELTGRKAFNVWGWISYIFCFPVKIYIIYLNLFGIIVGGDRWAFG
jgi:hypothetical protein